MEKKKRMKLRISRIFCSSLSSCSSSRNITDVALHHPQPPPSSPHHHHHHLFHLFSPKSIPPPPPSFPSITITSQKSLPRRKVSDRNSLLFPSSSSHITTNDGRKCPPASPISPLPNSNHFDCKPRRKNQTKTKKKKKKKKKNPTTHLKNQTGPGLGLGQSQRVLLDPDSYSSHQWLTSEEEEEEEDNDDETTLFSSKSLSSESSDNSSFRRRKKKESAVGGLEGKMEDSFPVVKRSRDPYSDFRTSMVEMIVEKQQVAGMEVERLLDCFLSLNSYKYHLIIVEVFTEICEALFSNWS